MGPLAAGIDDVPDLFRGYRRPHIRRRVEARVELEEPVIDRPRAIVAIELEGAMPEFRQRRRRRDGRKRAQDLTGGRRDARIRDCGADVEADDLRRLREREKTAARRSGPILLGEQIGENQMRAKATERGVNEKVMDPMWDG